MTQASPEVNFSSREDTLLQNKPELTTADVIILGEDIHTESEPKRDDNYEELLYEEVESGLKEFDSWLSWRVKHELITQIFCGIGDSNWQINISSISDVIREALMTEKDNRFQNALRIENELLPLAQMRQVPVLEESNYYWKKDVNNLFLRSDTHRVIVARIAQVEATGEEGLYDLSENYIHRNILDARDEVLAIVTQQKRELEEYSRQNATKIGELENAIGVLESQLEERDMELLDQELAFYAMKEVKEVSA